MLKKPDYTITYCMNAFPAYNRNDLKSILEKHVPMIIEKTGIAGNCTPLGLWFPYSYIRIPGEADFINEIMTRNSQEICTLNGFPADVFHGNNIKERVYYPDWHSKDRLDFTCKLVKFASRLPLQEGIIPVSTVPITWGSSYSEEALLNIGKAWSFLQQHRDKTGKHFRLLFEPEPGCALDRTQNILEFLEKIESKIPGASEFLGICIDTCHCAVMHESPGQLFNNIINCGFPVDKIQVSSAVILTEGSELDILEYYRDDTYLHQTTFLKKTGKMEFYSDLPAVFKKIPGEYRIHYHIPIHANPVFPIKSSIQELDKSFFRQTANNGRILEIETYTFSVLPGENKDIISSVAGEILWLNNILS